MGILKSMTTHTFCRVLLCSVMLDVRPLTTVEERKAAWAYLYLEMGDTAEFHGPNEFYWHGDACCKWAARVSGWEAWLAQEEES